MSESAWQTLGGYGEEIAAQAAFALELNRLTESPIETGFGVAVSKMLLQHYRDDFRICRQSEEALFPDARALMIPQYNWQRFRIDWAFRFKNRRQPLVFVECDGAEFHSTREQIARDNAKDRAAREANIPLLRFSGSDIVSATSHCIMQFRMRVAPDWRMP